MVKIIPRELISHLEWKPGGPIDDATEHAGTENDMKTIRVFIASPGDVAEERDITSLVVGELRRIFGNPFAVDLEAVRWETHAWPDIGDDAQDVINNQIGEFDILVGVMWRRFGSPTKRATSGTGEEFERAYNLFKKHGRPKIMFYFRTTPFYTTNLKEISQFRKVVGFRKALEKLGVLYWTYDTPLQFERNVREHLIRQILSVAETVLLSKEEKMKVSRRESVVKPVIERPTVFLAYSHFDKDNVRTVYRELQGAGFHTWLDEQKLVPGQIWHQEVDRAIRSTDVVLLLLSSKTDLARGFVAKEIEAATRLASQSKGPVVIPVRLDQMEPPQLLRKTQWVDYFAPDGLARLIEAIERAWRTRRSSKQCANGTGTANHANSSDAKGRAAD